jgi:large subunit ribosomal protein L13
VKTTKITPKDIKRNWLIFDAKEQHLGRFASQIATVLQGKHKANFVRHLECGDFVVVTNSEDVKLTGAKWQKKYYHSHTGYIGGIKSLAAEDKHAKDPTFLVRNAVKGMLPKNKMGRKLLKNLKIYSGTDHPHSAQKPEAWSGREIKA